MASDPKKKNKLSEHNQTMIGAGVAIGVGVAIGSAMGNIGAGIAIGISIGIGVGLQKKDKSDKDESE